MERFINGSRDEVMFWINTPLRRLFIEDIYNIPSENNDLFLMGLRSPTLEVEDSEDLEYFIGDLEEIIKDVETAAEKAVFRSRIEEIRNLLKYL
jgi:hypothetical protein